MLNSVTKHILHCCLLLTVIIVFELIAGGISWNNSKKETFDPWVQYGFLGALTLYFLRTLTFLSFPQVLFNFVGLTIYNTFPDKIVLKGSPLLAPFICIRIVTRGDYPQLVRQNVQRNLTLCLETGLENFQIEVVSDKSIGLFRQRRIREIVVPPNYRTSSGALFKARALQYCLENSVNELADRDWIVHLDEETLLTENSVRGILNFVLDGKHQFGQGLITYANEDVVNWITTLADSFRVADDMGKLRLQFTMFHKPFFSMKGSYVVSQMGAERQVSFNNGLDGSVAEDCFFAMKAFTEGYTFNFVDGEMWEKSPFTLWDFVQQRKRWLQVGPFLPLEYDVVTTCVESSNPLENEVVTTCVECSNFLSTNRHSAPCEDKMMGDVFSQFSLLNKSEEEHYCTVIGKCDYVSNICNNVNDCMINNSTTSVKVKHTLEEQIQSNIETIKTDVILETKRNEELADRTIEQRKILINELKSNMNGSCNVLKEYKDLIECNIKDMDPKIDIDKNEVVLLVNNAHKVTLDACKNHEEFKSRHG
ncbi:Beta-1,4-mannosyltransferase egh [Habropoda laboriosa]|uniref:Beta-1,4-mannosyltransferase egh n=1 Tax=Habropoda laboriosa TaxID=597456 RepID=A0A0L7REP0_9HYME|nr:Beta-1,4-mannosyltransferase egh [Habropoda laboriosa]